MKKMNRIEEKYKNLHFFFFFVKIAFYLCEDNTKTDTKFLIILINQFSA